ncbi:MAG: S9 family peptidase [Phycisphaerae bacterium]
MVNARRVAWLLLPLMAAGCADPNAPESRRYSKDTTPLISRDVLFGNPDRAGLQISPDGTKLAYLAPVNGVLNVWVGPLDDPRSAEPVTKDTTRGVRRYFWAYTSDHIVYMQDKGGDENWRVYTTNIRTRYTRDLTPFDGVAARIQEVSHKFPNEILVAINNRDPKLHDIHRINILTGERTLVQQNDGYLSFTTDDDFNVRFAAKITPDGGNDIFRRANGGDWTLFSQIPHEDMMTTSPVGFDKSGGTLYWIDSRGRDTAAFIGHNLETGAKRIISVDPAADVSDIMMHPTEKTIEAVAFTYDRKKWHVIDASVNSDLTYLRTLEDGDLEITSRSFDDRHWIAAFVLDIGPVKYYHYDRESRNARFLFTNRAALESLPLAKMHPAIIRSRDGMNLVSYCTLPVWSDPDQDGRPNEALPMVLFVHGGPWARDNWGYNSWHQWLANRGYAVLSVNYRGSTGLGKKFINAADLEWSRKMHDDLIDAVDWAVAQGIADPKRVAIMGGSYGGYATLVGLTFTPDKFACGVDIVGPSSLITLLNTIPAYWAPMIDMFTTRVGDHRTEEGRKHLKKCSPLTYVDRIKRPLLIGQGANDPRVKQAEADQIVRAMKEKNIPVTYVLFPDEGHGFARPENRTAFNAVAEAFLARELGGRIEPIGDDFAGSSISVPEGADQVPGLSQSLTGK